jgi:hypothetical protein
MKITFSLPEDLVKRVGKIALARGTTLAALIRDHLSDLAGRGVRTGCSPGAMEALESSFKQFQFKVENKSWKREDLHERT